MQTCRTIAICVILAASASLTAGRGDTPPAAAFQVGGAVASPRSWTVPQLPRELAGDVRTVHYTLKGKPHQAHGVPLLAVLQAARPTFHPHVKNDRVRFVVRVRGRDGYDAAFSLAELLPEFGHAAAWLAWDRDGRPLPPEAGPVELLVPGDVKAARWVHGIAAVTVADATGAAR